MTLGDRLIEGSWGGDEERRRSLGRRRVDSTCEGSRENNVREDDALLGDTRKGFGSCTGAL